ncbi:311_t:CDS:2, partial [Paraglomus brasilianum]
IHKYFEREASDWDIIGFLDECTSMESYNQKIECYLLSLELITSTETGQRRRRALELQKLYRQASIKVFLRERGNRPDKKRAKEYNSIANNNNKDEFATSSGQVTTKRMRQESDTATSAKK